MTAAVLDASVLVDYLVGSAAELPSRVIDGLPVPDHALVEVTSALRRRRLARIDTETTTQEALDDLMQMPIQSVPFRHLAWRVMELADNLTPYDAAYVALAELLDVPLYTRDARLARAPGIRCEVRVLP